MSRHVDCADCGHHYDQHAALGGRCSQCECRKWKQKVGR